LITSEVACWMVMQTFFPARRNPDARRARTGGSLAGLGASCGLLALACTGELACSAQSFSLNDIITLKCKANSAYVAVQTNSLNLAANQPYPGLLEEYTVVDGGSGSYALQARYNGDYVCAESAGDAPLVANRTAIGPWEQWDLVDQGGGVYALRSRENSQYVTAAQGNFIANQPTPATDWEKFVVKNNAVGWRVIRPHYSSNEIVVAACTPQDYGATGDGVTDDTAAFQDAANRIAALGGGVIFVPAASYAFQGTLNIPDGITLHGDWQDWSTNATGAVGTIFKVYGGRGQSNSTPFIFLNGSTALKGVTLWYPEQDPANIVPYPFCIGDYGDNVIQNVILVNPYQGIQIWPPTSGGKHILSTVIGSPLFKGLEFDMIADIGHLEDIRFNPDVWPASKLAGAPASGGPHAAWMRANGTGFRLLRIDGETCIDTFISGYKVGLEANHSTNGQPGATFYSGSISNCGTALLAPAMAGQSGLMFTKFIFDGDTCVNSQPTNDSSYVQFHTCQFYGHSGLAVTMGGNWSSRMQFQNCVINGKLQLNYGLYSIVNSTLTVSNGQYHISMSTDSSCRAALVGCNFSPVRSIYNPGSAYRVILDGRRAIPNALPDVNWHAVKQDYLSRQPARTNLYVVTDAAWGAQGEGVSDDAPAIQSALDAAGAAGGGIVFLPGGAYMLLGSLDVPSGVELRGTYELRHRTWPGQDGKNKGAILQPYANQTQPDGPPTVGVTFSYESQDPSSLTSFPPTIQGCGGNIYVIGVVSPNSWCYVDLDTYTCTNHLVYMADCFALRNGFVVGHGSSGSIVDCHANWTYWIDNYASQSRLSDADQAGVYDFVEHNNEAYILGDCSELLVKDFWIFTSLFTRCVDQNGRGPFATCFAHMCDITVEGFRFEAAAPSSIDVINPTMAILCDFTNMTLIGINSTSNFLGQARFFNSALFARPTWDFTVGGGDVRFDLLHMFDHSINGGRVDGGTLHLVNKSSWIAYDQTFPVYQIYFGPNAGTPGKISEVICCSATSGVNYTNSNAANPVKAWVNFPLLSLVPNTPHQLTSPQLLASPSADPNSLTLAWPGDIGYFGLFQTSGVFPSATWLAETNTPYYSNNQWVLTFPASNSAAYYRLAAP
jgi:hypothetical protein